MKAASTQEYFKRFYELVPESGSHKEAYQKTENEYKKRFGVKKYSDYHSFKNSKSRYLKNLRRGIIPKS